MNVLSARDRIVNRCILEVTYVGSRNEVLDKKIRDTARGRETAMEYDAVVRRRTIEFEYEDAALATQDFHKLSDVRGVMCVSVFPFAQERGIEVTVFNETNIEP